MMKVITLWEPWASLVAHGEKKNETRIWSHKYRGPLLIHAAKKYPGNIIFEEPFYTSLKKQHDQEGKGICFPGPCILAIANLVIIAKVISENNSFAFLEDVDSGMVIELDKSSKEYAFGDYAPGRFVWILNDIHQLKEPIRSKGMQRIWNFDETPHLVAIDPYAIGSTRIWTPKGVRSGRKLDRPDEDAVRGLEVA